MNKILIIEDCRVTSELLKSILTARGFECYTATDGLDGLRAAKNLKPDLILLDVMLPTMKGPVKNGGIRRNARHSASEGRDDIVGISIHCQEYTPASNIGQAAPTRL